MSDIFMGESSLIYAILPLPFNLSILKKKINPEDVLSSEFFLREVWASAKPANESGNRK